MSARPSIPPPPWLLPEATVGGLVHLCVPRAHPGTRRDPVLAWCKTDGGRKGHQAPSLCSSLTKGLCCALLCKDSPFLPGPGSRGSREVGQGKSPLRDEYGS